MLTITRNNPGNIRKAASFTWQGEVPGTAVNQFVTFDTLENGFRAMMKDINTKITGGTDTIRKVVTKWAPASDNNPTSAYISFVSNRTGIDPDQTIAANDWTNIGNIAEQMAYFEQGQSVANQSSEVKYYIGKAQDMLKGLVSAVAKKGNIITVILIAGLAILLLKD